MPPTSSPSSLPQKSQQQLSSQNPRLSLPSGAHSSSNNAGYSPTSPHKKMSSPKGPRRRSTKPLEGWLQKRGDKGLIKSYKRRYFRQNGENLYYYAAKEDTTALGSIPLLSVTAARITTSPNERKKDASCNFEVVVPGRIYDLIAPTDIEAKNWVRCNYLLFKDFNVIAFSVSGKWHQRIFET